MPNLDPVVRYQPLNPYHHYFDNLPIISIEDQLQRVNSQVDLNQVSLESAQGNAGSLASRLDKSLESNGAIKAEAIDSALHSIGEHLDNGGYVRMTDGERSKLSLIDDNATNLTIQIDTISDTLLWPGVADTFKLVDSDSVVWNVEGTGVSAELTFATSLVVNKSYDIKPITTDNINFKTTTINTPFKEGTLRVYVNGLRLTKSPKTIGGFYYEESDPTLGTFSLNKELGSSDIIRIDFDQPIS